MPYMSVEVKAYAPGPKDRECLIVGTVELWQDPDEYIVAGMSADDSLGDPWEYEYLIHLQMSIDFPRYARV